LCFKTAGTTMIQRIQTLYLLTALACILGFYFWMPVVSQGSEGPNKWNTNSVLDAINLVSAVLVLWSIVKFKQRLHQFVLNRLSIIFNFVLVGVFIFRSLNLSGEALVSQKGIGVLLPIISIVFLVLANKAIKRDEDLVKSVDRIR
jgi:hypothetical protein